MSIKNLVVALVALALLLSLNACQKKTPTVLKKVEYMPLNLQGRSPEFKRGASDGCSTGVDEYKKDHEAFNTNLEYHNGWFAGRKNCEKKPREVAE